MPHRTHRLRSLLMLTVACAVFTVAWPSLATQRPRRAHSNPIANTNIPPTPASSPAATPATTTPLVAQLANLQPGLMRVVQDIDGDTIMVDTGSKAETVRLIGVDTPETHDPRKAVQCYGETAAAHTASLVAGTAVRLAPDPADSDRDKYGRLLRYVYLADGTLLNAQLIREGYGFAYTVFDFTKLDEFKTLETSARSANRGLWGACRVDDSQLIKQTIGSK